MSKKLFLCVAIIIFLAGFIFSASRAEAEINVYDNDGQHLGVLISQTSYGVTTWLPSTGKFLYFHYASEGGEVTSLTHCDLSGVDVIYKTSDCSGTPYVWIRDSMDTRFHSYPFLADACGSYLTPKDPKMVETVTGKAYRSSWDCECHEYQEKYQEDVQALELVETSAPPFTLPVSLPFTYEHSILGVEKVVIGPP